MSQAELARAVGIKPPSMHAIESGKAKSPAAATLLKLAAVLEANPHWIMTGRGSPHLDALPSATVFEMIEAFRALKPEQQATMLALTKSLVNP